MKPGQKIAVEIDADGKVELTTTGFRGARECHEATKELEKLLGVTTNDQTTAEGRQQAGQGTTQRLGH